MDIYEAWSNALKDTEIVRSRIQSLLTDRATTVPYILLSESSINLGDTVVRKGEVTVEKPTLILPPNIPELKGFEFEGEERLKEDDLLSFLIVRGVSVPSLTYNNKTHSLDIFEGSLGKAVTHFKDKLTFNENVSTGLIIGKEELWQFSVLIYICSQISRNAEMDIRRLLDEFHRKR